MKFFKILLKFVTIAVIAVVLPRVSSFVFGIGEENLVHRAISIAFALTLGLGTISTAYFTNFDQAPEYDDEPTNPRERKRREREAVYYATMLQVAPVATVAMIVLAMLDGTFNLADAINGAVAKGVFDAMPANADWVMQASRTLNFIAVVVFGVAPTIIAVLLAKVSSMVDRIPMDYERPSSKKQIDYVRTLMGNMGFKEFRAGDAAKLLSDGSEGVANTKQPNVRRTPNRRTPNTGSQHERIVELLDQNADPNNPPSITQIQNNLTDPVPSRSTISVARNAWLDQPRGRGWRHQF